MKKAWVFGVGGIGLATILGGGGYRAASTCVLGVRGTRATVTIQAPAATFRCKSFAQSNGDYYVRTEPVTEPVLCEGEKDGLHYTVRDDGVFVLVGRMLCGQIRQRTASSSR